MSQRSNRGCRSSSWCCVYWQKLYGGISLKLTKTALTSLQVTSSSPCFPSPCGLSAGNSEASILYRLSPSRLVVVPLPVNHTSQRVTHPFTGTGKDFPSPGVAPAAENHILNRVSLEACDCPCLFSSPLWSTFSVLISYVHPTSAGSCFDSECSHRISGVKSSSTLLLGASLPL